MKFDDYSVALITDEKQRFYYLGYRSTDGYLILTKSQKILVIDGRYFYLANKRLKNKGVKVVLGADYKVLKEEYLRCGGSLGLDYTKTTLSELEKLKEFCSSFKDISSEIAVDTSIKTEEELKNIEKACKIAEKSWREVLPEIKEGITERELADRLEALFKKHGASGTSFDTIIAFGENSAVPHHETSERKLKKDECVLMDFGCVYKGYCSDMTRTMFFGKPNKEFLKAYGAVLSAHKKASEFIKAGVSGKIADKVAREELESRGYGEYFTHSLGHGIGVNIHEYPLLSPKSEWCLEESSVFSNEPGVYFDGKFGIRIEDSATVFGGKYKSFMKDDKSLIIINGDGKLRKINKF